MEYVADQVNFVALTNINDDTLAYTSACEYWRKKYLEEFTNQERIKISLIAINIQKILTPNANIYYQLEYEYSLLHELIHNFQPNMYHNSNFILQKFVFQETLPHLFKLKQLDEKNLFDDQIHWNYHVLPYDIMTASNEGLNILSIFTLEVLGLSTTELFVNTEHAQSNYY